MADNERKVTLLLKRGLKKDLPTLLEGEMGLATDTKELFIGSATGNVKIAGQGAVDNVVQGLQTTNTEVAQKAKQSDLAVVNNNLMSRIYDLTQSDFILKPPYKVRANPLTLTFNNAKQIASSVEYAAVDSGTGVINPVFRYTNPYIVQAGPAYPDYKFAKDVSVTTTNSKGNIAVEFEYNGAKLEIFTKYYSYILVLIDEGNGFELAQKDALYVDTASTLNYVMLNFGSAKLRRIRVYNLSGYFGGVFAEPGATVTASTRPLGKKAVFIGDSFTEGSNAKDKTKAYPQLVSDMLGYECINSGVGGTGYLKPLDGRVKFRDRIQHDVIDVNPDIVFIAGGINDTSFTVDAIKAEADLLYKQLKTALPNAKIVVIGNWFPKNPGDYQLNLTKALKEAALANGLPYIDVLQGDTYKGTGDKVTFNTGAWVTGTGNAAGFKYDGNADLFTSSDTTHPTQAGHYYLAKMLAVEIYKVLNS
ncbi:hypothetical protein CPT_Mater169 [Bacillus phage Mater]|uniref:SGNH hydrolase-type esterase domain-containing protein n=1 Tax=Bacillus phage Mater TaxID=1540090 RepID=A0A0A0RS52_9CAUD|nr:tail protein [Bacillus phage Mater]AIW03326.1 hypothetical protein CPT_Mater169 [Bacillus phage Mater]